MKLNPKLIQTSNLIVFIADVDALEAALMLYGDLDERSPLETRAGTVLTAIREIAEEIDRRIPMPGH